MRRTMLACIAICAALGGASGASAQFPDIPLKTIPAPAEPGALPLYPAGVPGGSAGAAAEHWNQMWDARAVRNVTRPTLTPVLPDKAKATGAAVIVAPGGAFLSLSMDSEGWGVAHWLADHGIAAFVLKYRLNPTPDDDKAFMAVMAERMGAAMKKGADHAPPIRDPEAADDAVAALRLVRARAGEWGLDPRRVGLIGFSAGAMTVLDATLRDAPDARPDFLGMIYGPMAR